MGSRGTDGERAGPLVGLYKATSLILSVIFVVVGVLFFFFGDGVLALFNRVSDFIDAPHGPEQAAGFYLGLAVSYMYLVALIAFLMRRHPHDRTLPLLLINGKAASSLLSVALFTFDGPFLIYGANAVIDGGIAVGVFLLYRKCMGRVP